MGICAGKQRDPTSEEAMNSEIDGQLGRDKAAKSKEIKILLLGAGESGKSTVFKQMKIIHMNGYTTEECMAFKDIVHSNTLASMKAIVGASVQFGIPIEPQNREIAMKINSIDQTNLVLHIDKLFTPDLGKQLQQLWSDSGIRSTFERRNEFQLNDSAEYYFDNLERISDINFVPSEQDVLRSRVKTTGIVETSFKVGDYSCKMFDVGGQRNERKKWIHCFEDVTAIIFVSSLNEYDLRCYEDDSTNRMHESLMLFDEICNSKWFIRNTHVILFLNKVDLFSRKIDKTPLTVCFPEYEGPPGFDAACSYVAQQFKDRFRSDRGLFIHYTTATDTSSVRAVFDSISKVIMLNNSSSSNDNKGKPV